MTENEVIQAIAINNPSYTAFQLIKPIGILVHSTGCNNPFLKRYIDNEKECGKNQYGNHWNNSNVEVSVHAFIGKDIANNIRVAQMLPYNVACWGCGSGTKGSYNYNPVAHIQFEMCEDDLTDKDYFDKVYKKAVEYCVLLCKKFGFTEKNIVSHQEAYGKGYASGHSDPSNWFSKFGKTMNDFRNDVKQALNNVSHETIYKVQVGAFKSKSNALKLKSDLEKLGYNPFIVEV